ARARRSGSWSVSPGTIRGAARIGRIDADVDAEAGGQRGESAEDHDHEQQREHSRTYLACYGWPGHVARCIWTRPMSCDDRGSGVVSRTGGALDVERDSDVPISTQIYWQLAYQIDSGRLLPGARLPPVRELGAGLRVNPDTLRAVYRRLADAGYVTSRHGAGTHVAARPPQRRGAEALARLLPRLLRPRAGGGV